MVTSESEPQLLCWKIEPTDPEMTFSKYFLAHQFEKQHPSEGPAMRRITASPIDLKHCEHHNRIKNNGEIQNSLFNVVDYIYRIAYIYRLRRFQ